MNPLTNNKKPIFYILIYEGVAECAYFSADTPQ